MTKQELAEIKARCKAATEGPWDDKVTAVYKDNTAIRICADFHNFESDAYFIARARADIPALIAEIERLQADYDRINDFEQSQCAKLLAENASLKKALNISLESQKNGLCYEDVKQTVDCFLNHDTRNKGDEVKENSNFEAPFTLPELLKFIKHSGEFGIPVFIVSEYAEFLTTAKIDEDDKYCARWILFDDLDPRSDECLTCLEFGDERTNWFDPSEYGKVWLAFKNQVPETTFKNLFKEGNGSCKN